MKTHAALGMAFAGLGCLAWGCAQTVEVQTFVLDADIVAPPLTVPVHLATPESRNTWTVSPTLSIGAGKTYTGDVEGSPPDRGAVFYPVDTVRGPGGAPVAVRQVPADNLSWSHPDVSVGLDLEYAWNHVAINFGGSYSSTGGQDLWGWRGGLGFFGQTSGGMGIRLDLGLGWQMDYRNVATAVVVTEQWDYPGQTTLDTTAVAWYRDAGVETGFGLYAAFTLNTAAPEWPVNGFLQVSYATQSLFDFEPTQQVTTVWVLPIPIVAASPAGDEVATKVKIVSLTPGLFASLTDHIRLVAGARVWVDVSGSITGGEPGVQPFMQVDFILPTVE